MLFILCLIDSCKARRSVSTPSSGVTKPAAIYIYSNREKDLDKSRIQETTRLRKCGFELMETSIESLNDLSIFLNGLSLPKDTPVFISASHGGGTLEDGTAGEMQFDPFGHKLPAADVLSQIKQRFPNASILVDVCHSGLCRKNSLCGGIGTTCGTTQLSWMDKEKATVTWELTELWCDSINTCTSWAQWDKDHDNVLNGTDINDFLADRFKKKGIGGGYPRTLGVQKFTNWDSVQEANRKCRSQNYDLICEVRLENFKYSMDISNDGTNWSQYNFSKLDSVYDHKSRNTDFPDQIFFGSLNEGLFGFSKEVQSLLDGKWPAPALVNSGKIMDDIAGVDGTYKLSEKGDILETDVFGFKNFIRLNSFEIDSRTPPIECGCMTEHKIPYVEVVRPNRQEIMFDDEYKIVCKK